MHERVVTIAEDLSQRSAHIPYESILSALESGGVVHFPIYAFKPLESELALMTTLSSDTNKKNISYHHLTHKLAGVPKQSTHVRDIQTLMARYAVFAHQLVTKACPHYKQDLRWGRTSFRPAEIEGRVTSKRQDDTRVHVDAFPATPVDGQRILRVFCNVNPEGKPRVWHLGEPFAEVIDQFSTQLPRYNSFKAYLMRAAQVTKTLRTPYDHYMLSLHDRMKLDDQYQCRLTKQRVDFPAQSSWIVFTDHVSHAALSGQFVLEQTFYLPVEAMANPEHAPLTHWQRVGLVPA